MFGEDSSITKKLHAKYQELAAQAGTETKEQKELSERLAFLRRFAGSAEFDEEIKKTETKLEEAKAKYATAKSPSDELRSAEARRANAAKKSKEADDEVEAAAEARSLAEVREAKAQIKQAEARAALDEADVELEKRKRAVAHSGPVVVVSDSQAVSVARSVAAAHTVVSGARAAAQNQEFQSKLSAAPELKAIFDGLIDAVSELAAGLPPELRRMPKTTLEGRDYDEELEQQQLQQQQQQQQQQLQQANEEAWTVIGTGGKKFKISAAVAPPPPVGGSSSSTTTEGGETADGNATFCPLG